MSRRLRDRHAAGLRPGPAETDLRFVIQHLPGDVEKDLFFLLKVIPDEVQRLRDGSSRTLGVRHILYPLQRPSDLVMLGPHHGEGAVRSHERFEGGEK